MAAAAELKKLFGERVSFSSGGTSWVQVRLSARGLADDQIVALSKYLNTLLTSNLGERPASTAASTSSSGEVCANLDLSENGIGSAGIIALMDVLGKFNVSCKCVKLYKNKIGDDGGLRLARMITNQTAAIEELHLSHNVLSLKSLVALCMAVGKHEGYPQLGRNRLYIPCWLRLEYNNISNPMGAIEALRRDGEVPICLAEDRDQCGPWRCIHAGRAHQGVPKVHMFTIGSQSRSHRPDPRDDDLLREEIRRWGGKVGGPSVRLPAGAGRGSASYGTIPGAGPATPKAKAKAGATRGWGAAPAAASAAPGPAPWAQTSQAASAAAAPAAQAAQVPEPAPEPAIESAQVSQASQDASQIAEPRNVEAAAAAGYPAPPPVPAQTLVAAEPPPPKPPACPVPPPPPKEDPADTMPGSNRSRRPSESDVSGGAPGLERQRSRTDSVASSGPWVAHETAQPKGSIPPAKAKAASAKATMPATVEAPPPKAKTAPGPAAAAAKAAACPPEVTTAQRDRPSLLLDSSGKRRIAPEQLEGHEGDASRQFVCQLCCFVVVRPVMTSCCHLFCEPCFRAYVADQVSKQKSKGGETVPLLPCPWGGCDQQLQRKDITALEKATEQKMGAAALLQRLRNNLRVKCVHHSALFSYPFGRDAETISLNRSVTCTWVGDLAGYEEHLERCPVEPLALAGAQAAPVEPVAVAPEVEVPVPEPPEETSVASAAEAPVASVQANSSKKENTIPNDGEVRVVRYDYFPQAIDKAQIPLKQHDLVRVFEVTETGWAAGVRLAKNTREEIGDPGWFPAAYVAAEAA